MQLSTCMLLIQRQMNAENTASDKPNIPVVGLSSRGHSVISLLSASVLISTQLPPTNTQHTTKFYTYRQMLYKHNAVKHMYYLNVHNYSWITTISSHHCHQIEILWWHEVFNSHCSQSLNTVIQANTTSSAIKWDWSFALNLNKNVLTKLNYIYQK